MATLPNQVRYLSCISNCFRPILLKNQLPRLACVDALVAAGVAAPSMTS